MGYWELWVLRAMGYEGFDCTYSTVLYLNACASRMLHTNTIRGEQGREIHLDADPAAQENAEP
jgi:hypothetical protein